MNLVALLSLLLCSSGFSIRCYTRGLIGGSPRRRRQTEEKAHLLFCADNQICMISGNTGNPFASQACAELLPGYPPQNCRDDGRDGAFTCWCSQDSCNESKEKIEAFIAMQAMLNKTASVPSSSTQRTTSFPITGKPVQITSTTKTTKPRRAQDRTSEPS